MHPLSSRLRAARNKQLDHPLCLFTTDAQFLWLPLFFVKKRSGYCLSAPSKTAWMKGGRHELSPEQKTMKTTSSSEEGGARTWGMMGGKVQEVELVSLCWGHCWRWWLIRNNKLIQWALYSTGHSRERASSSFYRFTVGKTATMWEGHAVNRNGIESYY